MKRFSNKRAAIEREYKKAKYELYEEYQYCYNCGNPNQLTVSHLVPRSRRRDLIAYKGNLMILCQDCHHQLDFGDRTKLDKWPEILERIKGLDREYYELLQIK